MKRAKKGELSDELRQAEQLRRMQETAFGQRLLAPLPEKSAPAAAPPVVKPVPAPAPKQKDIDEEVELNLELATPDVQPTHASELQPQEVRANPAAETTRGLLAKAPGTTQAFHDTPTLPVQVLPEHNLHDRSTTITSKSADGPKAPASIAAAASSAIPNATAPESAVVSNISLSSLASKRGSLGSVAATAALTQAASATSAHPSSALPATEPLPESTAEAPSASDATLSAARPRASSAESLAKKSPQRTSAVAPSHHRSTDAALEATRSPEEQQQPPSAPKSADTLLDVHLAASTRPAVNNNKALATGAEREPASDDESDNSDAGDEEGGADVERTRLPDQESDAASVHRESLASFMEASEHTPRPALSYTQLRSTCIFCDTQAGLTRVCAHLPPAGNHEEMETLLLDEDDEDTRNLYDEYLKLKYSNEELKLIGTFVYFCALN